MSHERTKEMIFEKFHKLTQINGIKKVTMEMLAKECGISKKTVYKYFDSKDELIEKFIDLMAETIQQGFNRIENTNAAPEETLFMFFDMVFEITRNLHPAILEDAERYYPNLGSRINMLRSEISLIFMNTIRKGIADSSFKNIDPIFVESFYFGAVNNVFTAEFMFKTGLEVNEILNSFKSMLLTGLLKNKTAVEEKEPVTA